MLRIELFGLEVRVSFWLCAFFAAALASADGALPAAYALAAAAHELAHMLCLNAFGARARSLTLMIGKFELDAPAVETLPKLAALAAFLSGPAANLALCAGARAAGAASFARANLLLGAMNLLPASHLDGGRALALVLSRALTHDAARRALKCLSIACGVAVCALGALILLRASSSFTALLFGIYIIIGSLRD